MPTGTRVNIIGDLQAKIIDAITTTYPDWNVQPMPDTGEMFVDNPNGNIGVMFTGLQIQDIDEGVSPYKNMILTYKCVLAGSENFLTKITSFTGDLLATLYRRTIRLTLTDNYDIEVRVSLNSIDFNSMEDGVWIYECLLQAQVLVNQQVLSIRQSGS